MPRLAEWKRNFGVTFGIRPADLQSLDQKKLERLRRWFEEFTALHSRKIRTKIENVLQRSKIPSTSAKLRKDHELYQRSLQKEQRKEKKKITNVLRDTILAFGYELRVKTVDFENNCIPLTDVFELRFEMTKNSCKHLFFHDKISGHTVEMFTDEKSFGRAMEECHQKRLEMFAKEEAVFDDGPPAYDGGNSGEPSSKQSPV